MSMCTSTVRRGLGMTGHQFLPSRFTSPEIPHTEITGEQPDPRDRIAVMWLGMFQIFSPSAHTSSS